MLNNGAAGESRSVCEDGLAVGGDDLGGLEEGGCGQNDTFRTLVRLLIYCFLIFFVRDWMYRCTKDEGEGHTRTFLEGSEMVWSFESDHFVLYCELQMI